MASESSKEPVLASSPGTLQALIHEELRQVAKFVSRSTMEKLAGVRANFLYTAYIVKRTVTTPKIGSSTSRRREKLETNSATRKKANSFSVLKPNRGRTEALGPRNRDAAWWHVATPLMFGRLSRMTPNGALRCRYRPSCYWEATWGGRSSQGQVSLVSLMTQGGRRAHGTIQSTSNHQRAGYRP